MSMMLEWADGRGRLEGEEHVLDAVRAAQGRRVQVTYLALGPRPDVLPSRGRCCNSPTPLEDEMRELEGTAGAIEYHSAFTTDDDHFSLPIREEIAGGHRAASISYVRVSSISELVLEGGYVRPPDS